MNHEDFGQYHSNASSLALCWNSASHSNPSLLEKWPERVLKKVDLKGRMCLSCGWKSVACYPLSLGQDSLKNSSARWLLGILKSWVLNSPQVVPFNTLPQKWPLTISFEEISALPLRISLAANRHAVWPLQRSRKVASYGTKFSFELKCIGRKENICNILEIRLYGFVSESAAKYFLTLLHMLCSCVRGTLQGDRHHIEIIKPQSPEAETKIM